jgi:bacterioferritin-associated ferredoxin
MYVCICNAVTDREIRGAVALGARTLADLEHVLGVGACCGRCAESAQSLVGDATPEKASRAGGDD